MVRLQTTFDVLSTSPIESAVDVLIYALDDSDVEVRSRALRALVSRNDQRSAHKILQNWDALKPEDIVLIREKKQNFAEIVGNQLQAGGDQASMAIEAAEQLELTSCVLPLITLTESSGSVQIKRQAEEAVLSLVRAIGKRARENRDQPTIRGPILARLVDSVQGFATHRSERLIEAFLEVSAWPDSELRALLSKPTTSRDLLCAQLKKTTEPGAIELLAGFVRRRDLPKCIGQVIQSRTDTAFRDAFLTVVGQETTTAIEHNLQAIGMPACCQGGERIVEEVEVEQLSAILHLYVAACNDSIQRLQVVAAAAERGGEKCMAAAAVGLGKCDTPETSFWMRAAIPVADGNEAAIASNENARLLNRLIQLLQHSDGAIVRSVRHVLSPLHVDNIIDRLESLRPRSRQRLGSVVLMIDSDAITRVYDALRHPVLANRLNAIVMAEALACVDKLPESFAHIVREDHQDARVLAAKVMADARSGATLRLLHEMTELPDCGVRDAALAAIKKRELAKSR
jgi:hypothetical protein